METVESRQTTMKANGGREILVRIRRFDPERDAAPHWETYRVNVTEGMTVLEALHAIKREQDASVTWRSSCRMGICGSCGMYINGLPRLACQTQILHLKSSCVTLAALPNYPIVKDLVPDLTPMFEKHAAVQPYLMTAQPDCVPPAGEYLQSPHEREAYGQFALCIKCGLCLAACPTVASDAAFLGPQALAQAYRYLCDNRDAGTTARLAALDAFHGPYRCHLAGACTEVCPKGVDPALAIQLLKRRLCAQALGMERVNPPAQVVALAREHVANKNIPSPPPRTVKA